MTRIAIGFLLGSVSDTKRCCQEVPEPEETKTAGVSASGAEIGFRSRASTAEPLRPNAMVLGPRAQHAHIVVEAALTYSRESPGLRQKT